MNNLELANLIFPEELRSATSYEEIYPKRNLSEGAMVTRLGPSPTGFIHLGNLYGAFVDMRMAKQSGGTFFLRIEDTDDKRYVEGAVDSIICSLDFFGIKFDEGATSDGERGDYGPYYQSQRGEIYRAYAKKMVETGYAYPCFLSSDEISSIRAEQEQRKETPGIYGKYAKYRDADFEEIKEKINSGEEYVLRLKSTGAVDLPADEMRQIIVNDAVRGELSMPENNQDIVILKSNGMPTYHFAHVIDDHLMRTTHVVRGAEWLSTLPVHIELFEKLGFEPPIYCHTAQLMKIDEETGQKRKLSKRLDSELSLDYYMREGYHPLAVREYLLTILNSDYEEWRMANPELPNEEFDFSPAKMNNSGALFDILKLQDISKDTLLRLRGEEIAEFLLEWARKYDAKRYSVIARDPGYLAAIMELGRSGAKPRKDLVYASQIMDFISYFFDEYFTVKDDVPDEVPHGHVAVILDKYLETYDFNDDSQQWFQKIRDISCELGYAEKPKDYKKEPEKYKGHVGHVSTVIRLAITGLAQSPDIWEIQKILGEERTRARINRSKKVLDK